MTLGSVVAAAARRFTDRPAVVAPEGWALTYRDVDRLSDEVAAGLAHRGVTRGDVVALAMPSCPDFIVAYVGAAKLGAVTAGVNPRLTAPQRERLVATSGARLLLGTHELVEPAPAGVDVHAVVPAAAANRCLEDLRHDAGAPPPPPAPADPVAIVFTSGTAGPPKGAVFTHGHLDAIARLDVGDRQDGGGPLLVSTELVHVGVMTKLGWYLRTGATLHLLRRWRAPDALRVITEQRISSVGAIAPQIALMLRQPDFDGYDLDCVTTIVAGGAPSPAALVLQARERFGAQYSIRYSSTESGGVGTATAFDAPDDEALHTVGRPRPGVDLQVRDDDGRPTLPGEPGVVCLRSPAVMAGYWRDAESTARTIVDGWLRTGDLGRLDEHGRLHLLGRSGDSYIRGGYNVHPEPVEAVLVGHPGVAEVAVAPRDDPVLGQIGVAVVVPAAGATVGLDDLRRHAAPHLAHHELPEDLVVVEALPRTTVDKLDRRRLRDAAAAPPPGAPPST
jgi:acyl-CoA synthetase (AMP-forming)/AMP-acid ligase II